MNKTILKLTTLFTLLIITISARAQVEQQINLPEENSIPVASRSSDLVAEKAKRTLELLALDSARLDMTLKRENQFLHPADDLYCGLWCSQSVGAYGSLSVPSEYNINVSDFAIPTEGRVTSRYGWRGRRMHKGVDLKLQVGDPVKAAFDGQVRIRAYERKGYGYYLVLRHPNGLETVYGHLSKFRVEEGDWVKAGDIIGLGGNTGRSFGSHLHFEFRFLGEAINPEHIVDFENGCIRDDYYTFRNGFSNKTKQSARVSAAKASTGNEYNPATFKASASTAKTASTSTTKSSGASSASSGKTYKIKNGDTLGAIARRYGTTVNRLCKLNNIKPTTTLRIGQKIRVS